MERPRSLAIISLGLACLLATACQTAGTKGQSPAATETQASGDTSIQEKGTPTRSQAAAETQAAANTQTQAKGTSTPSQIAAERQALSSRQPASRGSTTTASAGVRRAGSARQKGVADEALKDLGKLYGVITGREIDTTRVIDGAIAAGIVVLGAGTFAGVRLIRHRKLTPSSFAAPR
jgi:hypothetical protein